MDHPVSEGLETIGLDGQTTHAGSVGAETVHAMKWANDLIDAGTDIEDHSPPGGEVRPKDKPTRLRIIRARPFLAVIEGGKR